MSDGTKDFGNTAVSLARNPLGIVALFIVLVYGFACLVVVFASSFSNQERIPIVYFLVLFPPIVLAVFAWLVSKHSGKLYAPSDFKDEGNYVKMITAAASLGFASGKSDSLAGESAVKNIVDAVSTTLATQPLARSSRHNQILWVDDRPENNSYVRQSMEAVGLQFTLALNTQDGLDRLANSRYSVVISDMGRKEGPREGYVLLDAMRKRGDNTPLFFFASSNAPEHKRETAEHGGQGCTNDPSELFEMVTKSVIQKVN
jgi:CheY-like chemotaxis protein